MSLPYSNLPTRDKTKAEVSWNRAKKYEDSLIQDLFCGQLESSVRCQQCGHISTTFEMIWDLSIPVSPSGNQIYTTLEDCLKEYFREEYLEAPYKCEICKVMVKATKKLSISRFPAILVLHFKRFKSDPGSYQPTRKLNHPITFPVKTLRFDDFQSSVSETKKTAYRLTSVSNHFGSLFGGHYTATTKNWIDENWSDRNDSQVSPLGSNDNVHDNKAAYILFYERIYH